MEKKAAAMEFLMTYGWAILVALVVMGTVINFIEPSSILPEKCLVPPGSGLFCDAWSGEAGVIKLHLRNVLAQPLVIGASSYVTDENNNCYTSSGGLTISEGESRTAVFNKNGPDGNCPKLTEKRKKQVKGVIQVIDPRGFVKTVTADIVVSVAPGTAPYECGNDLVEGAEECDDGNMIDGDGCTDCELDNIALCGNGLYDPGEECDDGNTDSLDGCSSTCQLESENACGDGKIDAGEECDDGNIDNYDGCSEACQIENLDECGDGNVDPGEWCDTAIFRNFGDGTDKCYDYDDELSAGNLVCDGSCSVDTAGCALGACNDGYLNKGEPCDLDVFRFYGDGVSLCNFYDKDYSAGDLTCADNAGACEISMIDCDAGICGDGYLNTGEECDDGCISVGYPADCDAPPLDNGDGCDVACSIEVGGSCPDGSCSWGEECEADCGYEKYCSDGADNEEDGWTDCDDSQCFGNPTCCTGYGCP